MRWFKRSSNAPMEGDFYSRHVGDSLETAQVLEVGAFGFEVPHVKFSASVSGQEGQGTKVLSVAAFLDAYLPVAQPALAH